MDPAVALANLGGVAPRVRVERMAGRRAVDRALRDRRVERVNRRELRLPDLDAATRLATEMRGRVGVLSAAIAHGWEVPSVPARPWVVLGRGARRPARPDRAHLVWGDLGDESGLVTSQRRTAVDCARLLTFDVGLAVADSALRHGVDQDTFVADAHLVRGKGAAQARRIASLASPLPANPFEGLLHARAAQAGLDLEPQAAVTLRTLDHRRSTIVVHPDFSDPTRKLAIEADSWEFHSGKEAFQRDCRRYTLLVLNGWTVLRFTWWQVVHEPEWVIECLREVAIGPRPTPAGRLPKLPRRGSARSVIDRAG